MFNLSTRCVWHGSPGKGSRSFIDSPPVTYNVKALSVLTFELVLGPPGDICLGDCLQSPALIPETHTHAPPRTYLRLPSPAISPSTSSSCPEDHTSAIHSHNAFPQEAKGRCTHDSRGSARKWHIFRSTLEGTGYTGGLHCTTHHFNGGTNLHDSCPQVRRLLMVVALTLVDMGAHLEEGGQVGSETRRSSVPVSARISA